MARDTFVDTVGLAENDAQAKPVFRPLSNVQITVFLANTTNVATIYQSRAGASQKSNPFTTAAGGLVEFWAEFGEYDIKFHDLNLPARIGDKTIGWSATSAAAGGTPSDRIAADAGLPYGALGAVAQRQDLPIGAVIDWWRPSNTVAVPAGFAICDGTTITSTNHDFGTGSSIVLPDLRNAFTIGANIANADGYAGLQTDLPGNAPGIRGTGSSNQKDISHTHAVPGHTHSLSSVAGHTHTGIASGNTAGSSSASGQFELVQTAFGPAVAVMGHAHSVTLGVATDSQGGHTHTASFEALTTSAAPGGGFMLDNRPKFVGMLKIMKIKRN